MTYLLSSQTPIAENMFTNLLPDSCSQYLLYGDGITSFSYLKIQQEAYVSTLTCNNTSFLCSHLYTSIFKLAVYCLLLSVPPRIPGSFVPTDIEETVRRRLTMECYPKGDPRPNVKWFKDNKPLDIAGQRHLRVVRAGRILQVENKGLI